MKLLLLNWECYKIHNTVTRTAKELQKGNKNSKSVATAQKKNKEKKDRTRSDGSLQDKYQLSLIARNK